MGSICSTAEIRDRIISMIEKAGGVIVRTGENGAREFLCVHRPRYNDWSLPKGHVEQGETYQDAALREVSEETGIRCRIIRQLPDMVYTMPFGDQSRVVFFEMECLEAAAPKDQEVDEMRWCRLDECVHFLTHENIREYLRQIYQ